MRGAVRVTTLAGWAESQALGRKDRMEAGAVAPVTGADRMARPPPMETETGQEIKMGHKTETGREMGQDRRRDGRRDERWDGRRRRAAPARRADSRLSALVSRSTW